MLEETWQNILLYLVIKTKVLIQSYIQMSTAWTWILDVEVKRSLLRRWHTALWFHVAWLETHLSIITLASFLLLVKFGWSEEAMGSNRVYVCCSKSRTCVLFSNDDEWISVIDKTCSSNKAKKLKTLKCCEVDGATDRCTSLMTQYCLIHYGT